MTLRDDSRWPSDEGAGPGARLPLFEVAQPDETEWRHLSACKGEETDLFFPVGESGPAQHQAEEAKSYCRRCPVERQCLQFALELSITDGIWGGLTEKERRKLQRKRAGK